MVLMQAPGAQVLERHGDWTLMLSCGRPVRVLLADQHPIFLAGLKTCLAQDPSIEVVGEASSVGLLMDLFSHAAADVAIVSINFNGLPVIKIIMDHALGVRVIGLADETEADRAQQIIELGARGFVRKQSPAETVAKAITAVYRGGYFVDAPIAHRSPPNGCSSSGIRSKTCLTAREQQVLRFIALGFSVREAADRIGITVKSAETYKARATAKLEIDSRWKIVQYGILQGWFQ